MATNCKPGDRALVWRNTMRMRCACTVIGKVVVVEQPVEAVMVEGVRVIDQAIAWRYAGPPIPCLHGGGILALLDRDLRPLPPEEAVRTLDALSEQMARRRSDMAAMRPRTKA